MKTEISQLQKRLLRSAAGRESGALMLTDTIGEDDGAKRHAARGLMQRRFIAEIEVVGAEFVWKAGRKGPLGYVITDLGLRVIEDGDTQQEVSHSPPIVPIPFFVDEPEPPARDRQSPKRDLVLSMLLRTEGATVEQIAAATSWLPHTVRAALTNLRRQSYTIVSDKPEGARVYRATAQVQS